MTRTPAELHDECLVLAAQSGDEEAFEALLRRYLPAMARQARRLTGDRDAAAEITQDACLAIVRGLGRLEDPRTFEAWVRQIVVNKTADWIRRRQRQRQFEQFIAPELVERSAAPCQRAGSAESAETIRLVRQALGGLPRSLQVIVGLHYWEGRSVTEAARMIGLPPGTVKSRLFRARQLLKAFIKGNSDD